METLTQGRPELLSGTGGASESAVSAVSWPAIFAGGFVAAASSLVLVALGSGLGMASISPWPHSGASATTFTVMAAIWLILVQWLASGVGGYVSGRLRTKWVNTHSHEVFFRDTAHGFITWAVATILVATLLASAVNGGVRAAATVAAGVSQGAAAAATQSGGTGQSTGSGSAGTGASQAISAIAPYDLDMLFRSPRPDSSAGAADARAADARTEAARILANGIASGEVPIADRTYLAELVAARTGISQENAQKRVDTVIAQSKLADVKARQAADAARKSASEASIFTALSMLVGAFIACIAAALGGQRRDLHA